MKSVPKLVFLMAMCAVMAACTGSGGTTTATSAVDPPITTQAVPTIEGATTTTPAKSAAPATTAETPTEFQLVIAPTDLGDIVTDSQGFTLYVFLPDEQRNPTCVGECGLTWPGLFQEASAGVGIDGSLIGLVDSLPCCQTTYNGWPLYYYSGDIAPGDANGQGIGSNWFVIGADGEPITD